MKNFLTMILAGGRGERLVPLTEHRAKPAVPFGGKYRIIDFTLSNCINSGLRNMIVLIQYKSHSLDRHIRRGWNVFNPEVGEYIFSLPPQQRISQDWYKGTADAVHQNWFIVEDKQPEFVLILAGDHIYKMNYKEMHSFLQQKQADVVVDAAPLFEERFALNRAAVLQGKPMVECSMYSMEAHVTTILPGRTACLQCLVPEKPADWKRQFPVIGAVSGTAGCVGAVEVIKLLTGIGEPLDGSMLVMDLRTMNFRRVKTARRPDCPVCGSLAEGH